MVVDLQKASIWKRVAAWLFDFILMITVAVGVMALLSTALNYKSYNDTYKAKYDSYVKEFKLDEIDYSKELTEEEEARTEAADAAIAQDVEAIRLHTLRINLSLVILTFGFLLAILLMEFVLPLLLGNGQTLGKKVFALGLVRSDGVKVTNLQLFARAVLGKFTIETMIPAYVVLLIMFKQMGAFGVVLMTLLILGQIICMGVTRTNSALHDLMAATVVVDVSSQRIFENTDELIAYTKRIHAEQAARKEY